MINNCCWAGPSERCCKLNFYFFNFSSDRFWTKRKFNLPTPATTAFLFLLWYSALLGCIIAAFRFAIFLFTVRRDSQHRQNTTLQARSHVSSISHPLRNLVPLSCATIPPLDALADKHRIPKAKFSIFRTSQLFSSLIFR